MKVTPEINFTFEFTEDESELLLNALSNEYSRLSKIMTMGNMDGWKSSFEVLNEKLLLASAYGDSAITFTLSEAKELMEDIADAGLCDEFNELWSTLWNTLKSY